MFLTSYSVPLKHHGRSISHGGLNKLGSAHGTDAAVHHFHAVYYYQHR